MSSSGGPVLEPLSVNILKDRSEGRRTLGEGFRIQRNNADEQIDQLGR